MGRIRTHLDFLLALRIGDESSTEVRAALAGDDRVIVVALGDEQRGAIRLTTALNGARVEFLKVETPLPVDPADGTRVAYKNLELRQLSRHTCS